MMGWRFAGVAGGLVLAGNAMAQGSASVEQLEAEMKAMQEQMRTLQRRVDEAKSQAAAADRQRRWACRKSSPVRPAMCCLPRTTISMRC